MPLTGSARASTGAQTLDQQRGKLRQAGSTLLHKEQASGADRARPALARIRAGNTLVVRLDRPARALICIR